MYILAILSAFGTAAVHGGANILDSYFSNTLFKRLSSIIFFASATNVLFLPIVFIFGLPHMLTLPLLGIVLLISIIEIAYQFPYLQSFREADTSVVTSLFSVGELIIPLFAFLFVGERLMPAQYAGFFIIIIASALISFNPKKFRLSRAAFLMLGVSIILALQTVLYKYLFESGVTWGTAMTWTAIVQLVIATGLILVPKNRADLKNFGAKMRQAGPLFAFTNILSWAGEALGSFALVMLPASIVHGITGIQPIFVLVMAILLAGKFPKIFKEELSGGVIVKKLILFGIMIVGIILVTI